MQKWGGKVEIFHKSKEPPKGLSELNTLQYRLSFTESCGMVVVPESSPLHVDTSSFSRKGRPQSFPRRGQTACPQAKPLLSIPDTLRPHRVGKPRQLRPSGQASRARGLPLRDPPRWAVLAVRGLRWKGPHRNTGGGQTERQPSPQVSASPQVTGEAFDPGRCDWPAPPPVACCRGNAPARRCRRPIGQRGGDARGALRPSAGAAAAEGER